MRISLKLATVLAGGVLLGGHVRSSRALPVQSNYPPILVVPGSLDQEGLAALGRGDIDAAQRAFEAELRKNPQTSTARLGLAEIARRPG